MLTATSQSQEDEYCLIPLIALGTRSRQMLEAVGWWMLGDTGDGQLVFQEATGSGGGRW